MGSGRQGTRRVKAAQEGDLELAEKLKPPSEQRIPEAERCGALTQKAGIAYCQLKKGAGTDHPGFGNCARHGGNTEAGVKSAMREMGKAFIAQYKAEHKFGGNRHDPSIATLTPEQALLEEVRRSAAMVRFLEERIAGWNLTPPSEATLNELMTDVSSGKRKWNPRSMNVKIQEFLKDLDPENPDSASHLPALTERHHATGIVSFTDAREWLYLYREERGHLARVSKMCIDAGVAQRLVTLAEDQGRIMASAIRAVLTALNLSPEQAALVPQVVPPILRAVANDQPIPDISSLVSPPEALNG